ncbi:MAG: hypothetical protein GXP45_00425 [bacterium]|nr:hypothetical protein [bacterium]
MGSLVALAVMATAGTYAGILSFTGETITGELQPLSDTYFYTGCYSPVNIRINTEGLKTRSADVKFFLSGFFDIMSESETATYSGFYVGDVFNTYYDFHNSNGDDHLTGGTAGSGTYNGDTYWYINGYQSESNPEVTTSDGDFATVYVKPIMTNTSGDLDFYYLGVNINLDDSNISSGINADGTTGYTQYTDMLSGVTGTGRYAFNTDYSCPFKPYIASATYTSYLGRNIASPSYAYDSNVNYTLISTL